MFSLRPNNSYLGAWSAGTTIARTRAGAITVDGRWGDGATVSNTDTLRVTGNGREQIVTVDLVAGPLGPGKTAEPDGISEIEVEVDLRLDFDVLGFAGTQSADVFHVGSLGATLNPDDDVDVTFSGVDRLRLFGRGGDDALSGAGSSVAGDATTIDVGLLGGAGDDELRGGRGWDVLSGDQDDFSVEPVDAGDDVLIGGRGGDFLTGDDGNDDVRGDSGEDEFELGHGDDTYDGGSGADTFEEWNGYRPDGADTIAGGPDVDTLMLEAREEPLVIALDGVANDGADTSVPPDGTADEGDDIAADIEIIWGGNGGDSISADGAGADTAYQFFGLGGDDTLRGGAGDDRLDSDEGVDTLYGGGGDDHLNGSLNRDRIFGGEGDDSMDGEHGADELYGDGGDDLFWQQWGSDGADLISGGAGVDHADFRYRSSNLLISLDNGRNDGADHDGDGTADENDNVMADVENVSTGDGDDVIDAATRAANSAGAANRLSGGPGHDRLQGGAGEDRLDGQWGDDELIGGIGADVLFGSTGADTFFAADRFVDQLHGGEGTDTAASADASDVKTRIP